MITWLNTVIAQDQYITGDGFKAIADGKDMVFCETHRLREWAESVQTQPKVLIAHNSDACIVSRARDEHSALYSAPCTDQDFWWPEMPEGIKVFAQNADVADEQLTPIPIGLENTQHFPSQRKKQKLYDLSALVSNHEHWERRGLCGLQHNCWTNVPERMRLYTELRCVDGLDIREGSNGQRYDEYLQFIADHKFMVCPDGNGLDTVRMWECLYLKTVPIVKRHAFTEYFAAHLPIVIVDDFTVKNILDGVDAFLFDDYRVHRDMEMLRMDWWENTIKRVTQ